MNSKPEAALGQTMIGNESAPRGQETLTQAQGRADTAERELSQLRHVANPDEREGKRWKRNGDGINFVDTRQRGKCRTSAGLCRDTDRHLGRDFHTS